MPTVDAQTPLARIMAACSISQFALGQAVGCGQASISRLANGLTRDAVLAETVVDVLDGDRVEFDELKVLYPGRFRDWRPSDKMVRRLAKAFKNGS